MVKLAISLTILLSTFSSIAQITCLVKLEKIVTELTTVYGQDEIYLKYKNYSLSEDVKSDELITTMWIKGKKMYTENEVMKIYQDNKHQVYILKEEKIIMIQNITMNEELTLGIDAGEQIKKLKESALNISCEVVNTIVLNLPEKLKSGEDVPYQDVTLTYSNNYQLKKGIYKNRNRTDVYEYISYTSVTTFPFNTPLSKIFSNGNTLRKEFVGYEIKDYRNN